ncbi:MAG TPA: hypothetical protein VGM62_02265 [Chthoniobacterales bacterium]
MLLDRFHHWSDSALDFLWSQKKKTNRHRLKLNPRRRTNGGLAVAAATVAAATTIAAPAVTISIHLGRKTQLRITAKDLLAKWK